jgi:hypothetical protein
MKYNKPVSITETEEQAIKTVKYILDDQNILQSQSRVLGRILKKLSKATTMPCNYHRYECGKGKV